MSEDLLKDLPRDVVEAISVFLKNLAMKVGEAEVYLFGSYARDDWVEDSDIDLIVVSSRFRGMNLCERMSLLRRMAPDTRAFEILAYTPEEIEKLKHSVVIGDAIEYWVRIS